MTEGQKGLRPDSDSCSAMIWSSLLDLFNFSYTPNLFQFEHVFVRWHNSYSRTYLRKKQIFFSIGKNAKTLYYSSSYAFVDDSFESRTEC